MDKSNSDDSKVSTGMNFEKVLAEMYERMGYEVEITKGSGDQGADLILVKDGKKTVVQAKYSKGKVSSDAVREAIAAKRFYAADYGNVITNSSFQPNARELAEKDQIEMIDGDKLIAMMSDNDSQEKLLKPISKMTFDDIRPMYHNHKKIIQDILRFILRQEERPVGTKYQGNEIIEIIRSKLRSELLTKDDVEDMLETILGILKNEYELDVHEQEKEIQMAEKNHAKIMTEIVENKMPPYDQRTVYEFLEAFETRDKNPVSEQRLIEQLTLLHYTKTQTVKIIRHMVNEAMIYESSPGHYNTVKNCF
jgi:predicted RecB family endonuclease